MGDLAYLAGIAAPLIVRWPDCLQWLKDTIWTIRLLIAGMVLPSLNVELDVMPLFSSALQ